MLYDKFNLKKIKFMFFKNSTYIKFNLSNYSYLTNNEFNFLSLYPFFNFFFYNKTFYFFKKTTQIKVKKNSYFFLKLYSRYRNFFINYKYFFKNQFKINKFLIFNLKTTLKSKLNTNYLNFFKKKLFISLFLKSKSVLFKNWNYLVGSSISPFHPELASNNKIFRKDLKIEFFKNRNAFNFYNKNKKNIFHKNFFLKKIFLNNYFYLKKKKINYNQLSFLLKNKNKKKYKIKMSKNWLLSRPYLFLNNNKSWKFYKYYPNYYLFNVFKSYFKIFKRIKKFRFKFKFKKFVDLAFKKNFLNQNFFYKNTNNVFTKIFLPVTKHSPIFNHNYKYFNSNANLFSKKNRINLSKKIKLYSFLKINKKTMRLKKNKIYSNFTLNKNRFFSFDFLIYSSKIKKISRRIKKINTLFKLNNIFKKTFCTFLIQLNWLNKKIKNKINFNTSSIFFKIFTLNNLNNYQLFSIFFNVRKNINIKKSSLFYTLSKSPINNIIKEFKIHKKIFFFSKDKTHFLGSRFSFLFINDFSQFSFYNEKFFYNLKKIKYSFLYKNELQRLILKRYSKFSFLNKYFKIEFLKNRLNNDNKTFNNNYSSDFFNFFSKTNNSIHFILNKQIHPSFKWTYFNNQLNFNKNYMKDDYNFNIKRIKFKPGYMTLWRDSRKVLKKTLSLNFNYQNRLTNYLSKYNKFIKFKTFLILEMNILNILLKTRFFNNESVCNSFFNNNLVYLNGFICNNPRMQLFIGDLIQLIINNKYYILYRWFINISFLKKKKLKSVLKKKINISFDTLEKKKSNKLPDWILFNKNLFNDVPKYLEVDYFTLSAIVVYEPFLWSDLNIYNLINYRFGIINLYNWKYIN